MPRKNKTSDVGGTTGTRIPNLFDLLTQPGQAGVHETEFEIVEKDPEGPSEISEQADVYEVSQNRSDSDSSVAPFSEFPGDSFEKIKADGLECRACTLFATRNNFVLGEGNTRSRLVFIGEAPGADEDATGRPFVGKAGQHLDKILNAAGFKREDVYICNILKCRPPNNRTPTVAEMAACTPLLKRQLALIKPALIALLGNTAIKYVIGPDAPGITKIHGQWYKSIFGIPCMPLYHPSYLLRNFSREKGSPNWQMWQDIQALKARFDSLG